MAAELLELTTQGLYCRDADLYIDPWKPVRRAVVTHAHSDHARPGSTRYISHEAGAGILRHRLGDIDLQTVAYGETLLVNGVRISLHPAGHVQGSSQVRLEKGAQVWVVTGDY